MWSAYCALDTFLDEPNMMKLRLCGACTLQIALGGARQESTPRTPVPSLSVASGWLACCCCILVPLHLRDPSLSPLHPALQREGGQGYEACGPMRPPPPAMTMVLGGTARPLPVWRAASVLRGLCCTVCRVRVGRGEGPTRPW